MFTNKNRKSIVIFVCAVSFYVTETSKASVKDHETPLPIMPLDSVAYGFVGQPFSKQLFNGLCPVKKRFAIKRKKRSTGRFLRVTFSMCQVPPDAPSVKPFCVWVGEVYLVPGLRTRAAA